MTFVEAKSLHCHILRQHYRTTELKCKLQVSSHICERLSADRFVIWLWQVRWLHNNEVVSGSRYETLSDTSTHALHIPRVTRDDVGTFTVVASNSLGTASHSAKLSVDSTSLSKYQQLELNHQPVNGFTEPTASMRHWEPAYSRSPRSLDTEQPLSPPQLMPSKVVTLQ